MKMDPTPGPLYICPERNERGFLVRHYIERGDSSRVGEAFVNCGIDELESRANAMLWATADDLLQFVKMLSQILGKSPVKDAARDLVARATGRSRESQVREDVASGHQAGEPVLIVINQNGSIVDPKLRDEIISMVREGLDADR